MDHRAAACILVALAVVPPAPARADPPSNPDAARRRVLGSLATACRQFSRDDQWVELDACNAAWFKAHEEEVWRLDINPHAARAAGPSS